MAASLDANLAIIGTGAATRSVSDLVNWYYEAPLARYTNETAVSMAGGLQKVLSRDRMRIKAEFSVMTVAVDVYLRRDNLAASLNGVPLTRIPSYVVSWREDFDEPAEEFWIWASGAGTLYVRELLLQHT